MQNIASMTAEDIISDAVLDEVFSEENEIKKAKVLLTLEDRAAELGVKKKFGTMVAAWKRAESQMQQMAKSWASASLDNWTNFDGPYDRMYCGSWIAREDGIWVQDTGRPDLMACYHPILPVERLKNLETGKEQIKLAYKRNGRWEEIIVPKGIITSANKITVLSELGISVTSENAKLLVRYLADVENMNGDFVGVQYSSSKLGWIKEGFLPYDKEVVFDGESKSRQLYETIGEKGNRNAWFDKIRELRGMERIEVNFMLAASFASVLMKPLEALPFIIDLWGESEGGKSITLMVAASVWADPSEKAYIKDYETSAVGIEAMCDVLNHLPLMLDDTSKGNRKTLEDLENIVYCLCSGKGKTRSNKEIGVNRESSWRNITLTNGEKPLTSYVNQGGALNRVLELHCGYKKIYNDPQDIIRFLSKNHGFAGKEFVQTVKDLGDEELRKIQKDMYKLVEDDEKTQKQSMSLSAILTADRVATDYLFKDGRYIDIQEAKQVLIDRSEMSDNERCYQYILSEIDINSEKFNPLSQTVEKWGLLENGYAVIYNNTFDAMCRKGGFSKRSFLDWAAHKGLLQTQAGNPTKVKKVKGRSERCVWLKMDGSEPADEFVPVEDLPADGQEELPFK